MIRDTGRFAPKVYYFHPLLAGPFASWARHLDRCRELGFDCLLTAPLFAPGSAGDIFVSGDHERVHPAFASPGRADDLVANLAALCRDRGLSLLLDLVVGEVAVESDLARSRPSWFGAKPALEQKIDPRWPLTGAEIAYSRFDDPAAAAALTEWWIERLVRLAAAGADGFRCADPGCASPNVWRQIIAALRDRSPQCRFLAWTPGMPWPQIAALRGTGFSAAFSSVFSWNGRASWLVEENELLRSVGTVIGCPEEPFGPRLARRIKPPADAEKSYRHMLHRAAATGSGIMVPMGFEFAAIDDMDRRRIGGADLKSAYDANDFTAAIGETNALVDRLAEDRIDGGMRRLADPGAAVSVLLRSDTADPRGAENAVAILINPDVERSHPLPVSLTPMPPSAGAAFCVEECLAGDHAADGPLSPGEVRLVRARRTSTVKLRRADLRPAKMAALPRIVIENVIPAVDGGAFAAKHIVGTAVTVDGDIFTDGHEILSADVLWRAADESEWRTCPMQSLGNDRWRATFTPARVGRHEFTIEAWWDKYATVCRDIEIKRAAAVDYDLEVEEARRLLAGAKERTGGGLESRLAVALEQSQGGGAVEALLAPELRAAMRAGAERQFRHRREPAFPLEVERPQAAFGSWYELFPRSAAAEAGRHGTFDDVIARLPDIRDMGFDVLYMPPIHPIGETNRKGRNNSLRAEPDDVGSVYAIGSPSGGHDAIHAQLGTIEDFRRLRDRAAEFGIEIALDFAIQCSPDHPWLRQHPGWFSWRPDGSVRYAENPPKKYEDIVNVDFYQSDAIPGLWTALRDVVYFWVREDVRIFRVDNPHTKPLPFWEWLIAQVRSRHPEVIFLAEAFTRPKMMYRLAKIGFSQSYTYFTWRNTKQELTDYLTELTAPEASHFFRPHFLVNTPDINPYFLQTSGRAGFLIRAALAATLSGLWGMYSGFELCEAAALPGREEYLDSEKYELKPRDYGGPGNIKAEIARLNAIRRSHRALQSHLGLRFYAASNDAIIYYGKPLPAGGDMILVAVNLDPFRAQEATIEVPLWEWSLADDATVGVEDLMRGSRFTWSGKRQHIRLDPADLPFAIWRIAPARGI